jgi:hypothetical protein
MLDDIGDSEERRPVAGAPRRGKESRAACLAGRFDLGARRRVAEAIERNPERSHGRLKAELRPLRRPSRGMSDSRTGGGLRIPARTHLYVSYLDDEHLRRKIARTPAKPLRLP